MMNYKLVLSDIDGTLLNKDRELQDITIDAIKKLSQINIPFVLISARMPSAMRYLQKTLEIDTPIVCFNGAYIQDKNEETLFSKNIDKKVFYNLVNEVNKLDIHIGVYYQNEWFVNQMDYWAKREMNNTKVKPTIQTIDNILDYFSTKEEGPHKIMFMGESDKMDILENLISNQISTLDAYRSKDTYLEINPNSVSKATALDIISDYFKVPLDKMIAYGDNYNDVEMLSKVGYGVAMGNAVAQAKKVAKEITITNKEHGVAISLNNLIK